MVLRGVARGAFFAAAFSYRAAATTGRSHLRYGGQLAMSTFPVYPFTAFNFSVEINVPFLGSGNFEAAFSECDGLEMTMDVKTIREGGNNTQQIKMVGAVSYGQVTLKRGMTSSFDLWDW